MHEGDLLEVSMVTDAARHRHAAHVMVRVVDRLQHMATWRAFDALEQHWRRGRHRDVRQEAGAVRLDHLAWRWTHQTVSRRFNWWKQWSHRGARRDHAQETALVRLHKILLRMGHVLAGRAVRFWSGGRRPQPPGWRRTGPPC